MTDNIDLKQWVGRTERRSDLALATPVHALAATLDRAEGAPDAGDVVPHLRHWLYFLPVHRRSEVGPDGHPKRGGFLPPVALPRRMWAGGRLTFLAPLRVGEVLERESRIVSVDEKHGRSGTLVFVLVRHEVRAKGELAIVEEQDIVYRDAPQPGEAPPPRKAAPTDAGFGVDVTPDEVLLFRYSALTFNGHRIHYDRPYATGTEGYPGLVVHGPLIATMLLDLARDNAPGATVASFSFRAVSPLFDISPFRICGRREADGKTLKLWAQDAGANLAMEATAVLS